jgi:protein-S-isoprenylcysteine O-methyltransferase Ste14
MSGWWKGERGEWYVVGQFVLFGVIFVVPFLTGSFAGWSTPWNAVGLVLGLVLSGLGALLAFAGLFSLGRNLTAVPHPKDDAVFVERGAYRLVRHPIYSGIILGAVGWGLLTNSLLVLLLSAGLLLFLDIKSRREEQWLNAKFAEYAGYQQRVRKLIPFIY